MPAVVLIAEPDGALRHVYQHFFSTHGFGVFTASDGVECVGKLRQSAPSLLVLDARLLWGGAEGVLASLRKGGGLRRIPVIMTGDDSAKGLSRRFRLPASRCLQKPFRMSRLLEVVKTIV